MSYSLESERGSFGVPGALESDRLHELANGYFDAGAGSGDANRIQELANLESDRFMDRLQFNSYRPNVAETDVFKREMDDPIVVSELELGVTYNALVVNRDSPGVPIVLFNGLGLNSEDVKVRTDMRYLSHYTGRPIVSLDPIGSGGSSKAIHKPDWTIEDVAKSNVAALRTLGVHQADVVGYSWGGAVAANVAVEMGESARKLVTVSAVGFVHGTKEFVKHVPAELTLGFEKYKWLASWQVGQEIKDATGAKTLAMLNRKKMAALVRNAKIIIPPSLEHLPEILADATLWTDISASKDKLTNYKDHIRTVRERNARLPKSSEAIILGGEGHMWPMHSAAMMTAIASALNK